jgi:long-chain acyl-CoA synthetase
MHYMSTNAANRPWLKSYQPGVPEQINPTAYSSVVAVFEEACKKFADRPAFQNRGVNLSYRELDRRSMQFAAFLRNRLGLLQGDRVALMMPNMLQYPIAMFGILRAGCVVVNTNPLYSARELKHQLNDSGAKAIVVFENVANTLSDVIDETGVKHVITTGLGDQLGFVKGLITNMVVKYKLKLVPLYNLPSAIGFNTALAQGSGDKIAPTQINPEDLAFLQYTGGTTGVSKGAMLMHRNIVANMEQGGAWMNVGLKPGYEVIVTALPLYHIFALTVNCMIFIRIGALNVLVTDPRNMKEFIKLLSETPFSGLTGVNTLFNGLMNTDGFSEINFSTLKLSVGGGAAVQRAVADRWKKITGVTLVEGYGLTEASPSCSMNRLDAPEYTGSIGLPLPSTEFEVRDDDGKVLALGEPGELCVRGPQVMKGYWQRPEETAKSITSDGWLLTGDVAKMDEKGFFYIVDRKKDMILVSGFNVYPNEIEDVVAMMPGVLEVAAVGVPDDKTGEAVKVVIVPKDASLTIEAVKAHCRENMTGYKQPRVIEFRKELPKTNVGKILRRELRDPPKP